ncbi:MAG: divalent-cation tolerance protein CutA [Rhizobiales bacterium]|nr:divalent-cation tolerance protein CutA [Hyphomicrobiales bacterium]
MSNACVVMTTVANAEQARMIMTAVVEARLAACAQTQGISSCYRWDGKVVSEDEQLIVFKTMSDAYEALEVKLLALHPYDTPEIIRLPIESGSAKYLAWIASEVG